MRLALFARYPRVRRSNSRTSASGGPGPGAGTPSRCCQPRNSSSTHATRPGQQAVIHATYSGHPSAAPPATPIAVWDRQLNGWMKAGMGSKSLNHFCCIDQLYFCPSPRKARRAAAKKWRAYASWATILANAALSQRLATQVRATRWGGQAGSAVGAAGASAAAGGGKDRGRSGSTPAAGGGVAAAPTVSGAAGGKGIGGPVSTSAAGGGACPSLPDRLPPAAGPAAAGAAAAAASSA